MDVCTNDEAAASSLPQQLIEKDRLRINLHYPTGTELKLANNLVKQECITEGTKLFLSIGISAPPSFHVIKFNLFIPRLQDGVTRRPQYIYKFNNEGNNAVVHIEQNHILRNNKCSQNQSHSTLTSERSGDLCSSVNPVNGKSIVDTFIHKLSKQAKFDMKSEDIYNSTDSLSDSSFGQYDTTIPTAAVEVLPTSINVSDIDIQVNGENTPITTAVAFPVTSVIVEGEDISFVPDTDAVSIYTSFRLVFYLFLYLTLL